ARHHRGGWRAGAKARPVGDVGRTRIDGCDSARRSSREALVDTARPASLESTETDWTIRAGRHQRSKRTLLRSARVPAEFHLSEPRHVGVDDAESGGLPPAVRRFLA